MQKIIIKQRAMPAGRQGFSFLELMIVIAIAGIMTAVVLVSMNAQREKKAVEGAAREVAAVIRENQNYALTGKKLAGSSICVYAFGWANTAYNISSCDTQSYSLKNGVVFSNNGSFYFEVPFANISVTTDPLPNPKFPIDINLSKGSSNYHICIYTSGVIEESPDGCN